jgi:hypothetical protein
MPHGRLALSSFPVVVIPGHPHHVTQRGNGGARTFFGDADCLSRPARGELPCRRGRGVGLVPDAEPRAPYPGAVRSRRAAERACTRASCLCRRHPGATQTQRTFLVGPVRRRRHGRRAPRRGAAPCLNNPDQFRLIRPAPQRPEPEPIDTLEAVGAIRLMAFPAAR